MSEIIAKAMNSTLGTSNFKSFDELMRLKSVSSGDEFITNVPGTKGAIVRVGYAHKGESTVNVPITQVIAKFNVPLHGTVNIQLPVNVAMTFVTGYGNQKVTGEVRLYRNGSLYSTATGLYVMSQGATTYSYVASFNHVEISPNDVFKLEMAISVDGQYGAGWMQSTDRANVYGTLLDYMPVNIIS